MPGEHALPVATFSLAAREAPSVPAVRRRLAGLWPALAIWPPLILSAGHVVLFTLWTAWISFTPSTLLPQAGFVGLKNYASVMATRNFSVAYTNVVVFGVCFVALATARTGS